MLNASGLTRAWVLATLASAVLFTLMPGIDLAVSGLFFAGGRFPLAGVAGVEWLRHAIWSLSELAILVALGGLVLALATGRPALWLPARFWAVVLAIYVLAPGLVVNLVFKTHWGRARPAQVVEFGGTQAFTPALQPAAECARNCSFMSGEAAAAMALGIAIALGVRVLQPRLGPRQIRTAFALAAALALVGGLLRVMTGRHFLSDVMFGWLITAGVALVLVRLFLPGVLPAARARA